MSTTKKEITVESSAKNGESTTKISTERDNPEKLKSGEPKIEKPITTKEEKIEKGGYEDKHTNSYKYRETDHKRTKRRSRSPSDHHRRRGERDHSPRRRDKEYHRSSRRRTRSRSPRRSRSPHRDRYDKPKEKNEKKKDDRNERLNEREK